MKKWIKLSISSISCSLAIGVPLTIVSQSHSQSMTTANNCQSYNANSASPTFQIGMNSIGTSSALINDGCFLEHSHNFQNYGYPLVARYSLKLTASEFNIRFDSVDPIGFVYKYGTDNWVNFMQASERNYITNLKFFFTHFTLCDMGLTYYGSYEENQNWMGDDNSFVYYYKDDATSLFDASLINSPDKTQIEYDAYCAANYGNDGQPGWLRDPWSVWKDPLIGSTGTRAHLFDFNVETLLCGKESSVPLTHFTEVMMDSNLNWHLRFNLDGQYNPQWEDPKLELKLIFKHYGEGDLDPPALPRPTDVFPSIELSWTTKIDCVW